MLIVVAASAYPIIPPAVPVADFAVTVPKLKQSVIPLTFFCLPTKPPTLVGPVTAPVLYDLFIVA